MLNAISIFRGTNLLADGSSPAFLNGRVLSECEHALEIYALIRSLQPDVQDMRTKSNTVTLLSSRAFGSDVGAMDFALRGPQAGTGKYDLVIKFSDGTDLHTWTLSDRAGTGAAWQQSSVPWSSGVGTDITYTIKGGTWSYTGPLASVFSDAISGTTSVTAPALCGLPTVDPEVIGAVWNNGGALCLSSTGITPTNFTYNAPVFTGLPSADPVALGQLWNNGGSLCISDAGTPPTGTMLCGVVLIGVPTADPLVADQLWSNGGQLCVSAG